MSTSDRFPESAKRVKVIDHLLDYKGYNANTPASLSVDIETLIGEDLPDDVTQIEIYNNNTETLYYQPRATASATSFPIIAGGAYAISGRLTDFRTVRLFTVNSVNVGVIVRVPRE